MLLRRKVAWSNLEGVIHGVIEVNSFGNGIAIMRVSYEKKADDFVNERLRFDRRSRRSEGNHSPFYFLMLNMTNNRNGGYVCNFYKK